MTDKLVNKYLTEYKKHYIPGHEQYPELDDLAEEIAGLVGREINKRVRTINSKMPYKAQYVLEEVIKHLEEQV
jgi:hypothetical protein